MVQFAKTCLLLSIVGALLSTPLVACSSVTPHQNFEMIFGQSVGRSIDDPPRLTNAYPDRLVFSKKLKNGNFENEYRWYRDCRYFFEVDGKSRVIVAWHFVGSDKDCEIVP
jgi:hypothetical protein